MRIRNYQKVKFADEAYRLLNENLDNKIISGGAWLRLTSKEINTAIDLSLLNLDKITETDGYVEIGSMTTLREIEKSRLFSTFYNGIIQKSILSIMGVQIRNIATIGGTVIGKYGFSDLLTTLLALDANLIFYNSGEISLKDYLKSRSKRDILLRVKIKKSNGIGFFYTMKKTATDFAILNVAVTKTNDSFRIAVGARPGVAKLADNAMEFINNAYELDNDVIETTATIASDELKLAGNIKASKEYRENICKVIIKRGLKEVITDVNKA